MSNDLIKFNVSEMKEMATAIASSKLFGINDPNQMLALMLISQAEGLHPAIAARDYHIIQGKPSLKADAMLARYQASGGKVEWVEYTDTRVIGKFSHPSGGTVEIPWTIEHAKKAGVYKEGSGWTKYPRAMLRSRCVSEGIRATAPGCVAGTYTDEETEHMKEDKRTRKFVNPVETENVIEMASLDQVQELSILIMETQTPIEIVNKWLEKAGVEDISEMTTDIIQKCIDSLRSKIHES